MNDSINMAKRLLSKINNRSNDSSFRNKDNKNIKECEEDIINTNINKEKEDKNNNEGEKNRILNENKNDSDDIYDKPDECFAFKTKDKIKRTPPRQIKYNL